MKIGISLPIHERVDIVLNQILNINKYIDDPIICIHVSKNSNVNMDEIRSIAMLTGALVNEERFGTMHGNGLMGVHSSNFKKITKSGDIDYYLLLSSNEMFIKRDLLNYISKYDIGMQITSKEESPGWHLFNKSIENITELQKFMIDIGVSEIKGGQAEGQFFRAGLFAELVNFYNSHFRDDFSGFETEEVIPATFFSQDRFKNRKFSKPITLQNYSQKFEITMDLISNIRNNTGYISGANVLGTLPSPHLGVGTMESIFSVKRIDRSVNDIRLSLTNLMTFKN